jgi:hypothetical protein
MDIAAAARAGRPLPVRLELRDARERTWTIFEQQFDAGSYGFRLGGWGFGLFALATPG